MQHPAHPQCDSEAIKTISILQEHMKVAQLFLIGTTLEGTFLSDTKRHLGRANWACSSLDEGYLLTPHNAST